MQEKIIHQIWYQGWDKLPDKFRDNIRSVKERNPNWKLIYWDDESIRKVIANHLGSDYLKKYISFPYIHQKVDFARYALLYIYGGISVDADVFSYKNFDQTPFINEKDFIVSYNSSNAFENYIKSGNSLILNNATIISSKNNPVIKGLLDYSLTASCDLNQSKESCINETTGPKGFTQYLNNHKDQITVLDNAYLEPCSGADFYCSPDEISITDHRHEGSWISPQSKYISQTWYWLKAHRMPVIIIIILILLIIFW